jgi:hypothetical protein
VKASQDFPEISSFRVVEINEYTIPVLNGNLGLNSQLAPFPFLIARVDLYPI